VEINTLHAASGSRAHPTTPPILARLKAELAALGDGRDCRSASDHEAYSRRCSALRRAKQAERHAILLAAKAEVEQRIDVKSGANG
jgi:hypothetical protein